VSLARGRGRLGAVSALHPLTLLVRERRLKAYPAAFSNNTGKDAWLFEKLTRSNFRFVGPACNLEVAATANPMVSAAPMSFCRVDCEV
jgi:hypothetical protein